MKEIINPEINKNLENNIKYLKEIFKDNSDFVLREFTACDKKIMLCYFDGLSDKVILNEFVVENLMENENVTDFDTVFSKLIAVSDIKRIENLKDAINSMLAGEAIILMDGYKEALIVAIRAFVNRGVTTPENEVNIKGSRDAFTEVVRFNTVLIRRRIRDTRLKTEALKVGTRSKTDVVLMYIDDIVNKDALNEVREKIQNINIDSVINSSVLSSLIEDEQSIFPLIQPTERPDIAVSGILEGRIVIVVDNSPYVLIAPVVLSQFFQSTDDNSQKPIFGTFMRMQRMLGLIIALTAPAFYIILSSYSGFCIPDKLAYVLASTREGIPFSSLGEVLLMEIAISFLIEAIVRMPKTIGSSISIVGGLIIGQAAVSAGIVSLIMIIVVAITTISTFTIPNYDITVAIRILRLIIIILTSFIGVLGILFSLLVICGYLLKLKSFGIYYFYPFDYSREDYKNSLIRSSFNKITKRPSYYRAEDKVRQGSK